MIVSASGYAIDRLTAESAVRMCLPLIDQAMRNPEEFGDSGFLYIVVMNPALTPANARFEDAVLYEHSIGDRENWDADYAGFALAKARAAWSTGMDGHAVQELRPCLLSAQGAVLWGSVVLEGIVVSASGAYPWYDEAFAGTIAMCLRAMAKSPTRAVSAAQERMTQDSMHESIHDSMQASIKD